MCKISVGLHEVPVVESKMVSLILAEIGESVFFGAVIRLCRVVTHGCHYSLSFQDTKLCNGLMSCVERAYSILAPVQL